MPDITKLLNVIDSYADQAYGSDTDGGELARQRSLALDAYAGKNIEPNVEGRSQVTDWSVFETVNWIMPSLIRIFAGGDDIVEFEPFGPEDEEAATQESEYLNYIVTQRNNWFLTCLQWFQDALITKNAYCMAYMDTKYITEIDRYEGQSEEQVAFILEDDVEIVGQKIYQDPEDEGTPTDPMTGQPIPPEMLEQYMAAGGQPVLTFKNLIDVEVRRTKPVKRLKFRVLPPERCLIDPNTPDFTLDECDYFEFWDKVTLSELRAMGYDVPDDIGVEFDEDTLEDASRDEVIQSSTYYKDDIPDPSLKTVKARYIWVRHDYDEDGIAEMQHVLRIGDSTAENTVLKMEHAACIPVASIVPFINTHRHVGNSIADLTFDIQRIKTALLRGGLDSIYLALNPRNAVSDRVNLDDMLISRPGGVVRVEGIPGEGHILPLVTPDVFPSAQSGLLHMDQVIESRVGVNKMFQGIDSANSNDYNRIGQLSTMASQRVELIARIIANGVERLFQLAHEVILKSGHQSEAVKLRGQWVTIDPRQWRTGRDMRVVAPFSAGNKDALLQRLLLISQIHEKALAGGLPIVQVDDAYNLALEIAKAADVPGDRLFTDPATVQPPEPGPDYTMLALEIENKKAENQKADTEIDAEVDLEKTRISAELDKYKADLQAETQLLLAKLKAGEAVNLEQVRASMKDMPTKMANESIDATGRAVQELNAQVAQSIREITDAVAELKDSADSPREVVRDKSGRVTGVRVNGKVKPLKRDKDGKVIGI